MDHSHIKQSKAEWSGEIRIVKIEYVEEIMKKQNLFHETKGFELI